MKGRILGFSYNPKKHIAHFSLYVPKTFVAEYLEKTCARRAKKMLAIYRTIGFTRLVPHFGEEPLDTIRSCDVGEPRCIREQLCAYDEGAHEPCGEAAAHLIVAADREDPF